MQYKINISKTKLFITAVVLLLTLASGYTASLYAQPKTGSAGPTSGSNTTGSSGPSGTTGSSGPSSSTTRTRVEASCQKTYNAWRKAGGKNSGNEHKAWSNCLNSMANTWCSNTSHLQGGTKSTAQKKTACIGWYKEGFNNARNPDCSGSTDSKNKNTCYRAAGISVNFAAGAPSPTPSSGPVGSTTPGAGPAGTTPSGGIGSTGNADETTNAEPTVPQKKFEENQKDPAMKCADTSASAEQKRDCDLVQKYLNPMITFFSAFVGIAVVIGIISGGIIYASAGDDPQKTAKGRNQVRNAIIALVAYIFLYALMKWLIPQTA